MKISFLLFHPQAKGNFCAPFFSLSLSLSLLYFGEKRKKFVSASCIDERRLKEGESKSKKHKHVHRPKRTVAKHSRQLRVIVSHNLKTFLFSFFRGRCAISVPNRTQVSSQPFGGIQVRDQIDDGNFTPGIQRWSTHFLVFSHSLFIVLWFSVSSPRAACVFDDSFSASGVVWSLTFSV